MLRMISNSHYRAHTDALFLQNKILKVHDTYRFQLGQFMYKLDRRELPAISDDIFTKNNTLHTKNIQQGRVNNYHLPLMRTKLAQNTFVFFRPSILEFFRYRYKTSSKSEYH